MKGDYNRYISEFARDDMAKKVVEDAKNAY